jgi:hypothetical protein
MVVIGSMGLAPLAGCESLPGSEKEQGAVIGGVGGAVAGAALGGEDNRLVGALIGGALGAGGGYLIGANLEEKDDQDKEQVRKDATEAVRKAESDPATAEEARDARTADVNADGFVTLDEVIAMEKAGVSENEMIRRLERTNQEFALTTKQEEYLKENGINDSVINAMRKMEVDEARVASEKEEPKKDQDVDMRTDPR